MADKLPYNVVPGKDLLARMPQVFSLRTEPPADFDQKDLKPATLNLTEDLAAALRADGYEVTPAATVHASAARPAKQEAPAPEESAAVDPAQADASSPRRRKPEPPPGAAL